MIAIARDRAHGLANLEFTSGDAIDHAATGGPFDLFFSRHGVMFFPDPVAALTRLHAAATPGAPLVFSCFAAAADNPWASLLTEPPPARRGYVPGPFGFADEGGTRAILDRSGWRDATAARVAYRYVAGQGADPVADAVSYLSRIGPAATALREAAPADRPVLEARLAARLTEHRDADTVTFPAAAWIWSAYA
jgi:SAM-dependent methyltransferase